MRDEFIAGIPRSRWYWFRVWLSDLIHPDAWLVRRSLPGRPLARELATLVFLSGDQLSERDQREVLVDLHRRLGIKPIKARHLPYMGD